MDTLRQNAEALLTDQFMDISQLAPEALQRMFYELRVHEIELRMQNEELRRTQIELETSRKKYADLYDFAPVGYGTVNQEGMIVELNLTAVTQLERPRETLLGTRFYHYIAEDDRAAFFLCLRNAFDSHAHEVCELKLLKSSGETFWAQIEGIVMSQTQQCHLTIVDITPLKEIARQLQQEVRTKGELLREVNHRVGNNLMAIMGLLSMERSHLTPGAHGAYQRMVEDLNSRINSLAKVHELLSQSEWSPLALDDVCEQIVYASVRQASPDKRVSVTVTPSLIRVTAKQAHDLALILNELATNSVKYATRERDQARITLRISQADETIRLEFQDDGPGYPEDVLNLSRRNVGIELVFGLSSHNLRGDASLRNDSGAVTVITFPVAKVV